MTTAQNTLSKMVGNRQMGAYIEYIRFPFYKNLAKNTRIDFTFPITALVGQNGTNKSSVLRALQGCPNQVNLGNYWFATKLDPIVGDGGDRPCFIYGYYNNGAKAVVEVLKTRIQSPNDPNYWEPSRPLKDYGMAPMAKIPVGGDVPEGRSKTRWNAISKNVVYIDFRATLSAFDKFFYHGESRRHSKQGDRREMIIKRSPHLRSVIDDNLASYVFHKVERVTENLLLPISEVELISRILSKSYSQIRLVKHSFFNTPAYSAILSVDNGTYSEAVAGSGEFAIVMAIHLIHNAPENSLILMDEPEVSLHPGAQERLMDLIYDEVKSRRQQVVISTHSPTIVRKLPRAAIKIFVENPPGKVSIPLQEATHGEAFFTLGDTSGGKKYLVVEDRLAAEIVKRAMRISGAGLLSNFEVVSYPGGASSLWMRHVPVYSVQGRADIAVLFDGDQRPATTLPETASIPSSKNSELGAMIKEFTGCNVDFAIDGGPGGGNQAQLFELQRKYIDWCRQNVHFLPGHGCPEDFVLRNFPDAPYAAESNSGAKDEFVRRACEAHGLLAQESIDGNTLFAFQTLYVAKIPLNSPALVELNTLIRQI